MKVKRCPICDTLYTVFQKQCPNCFYKEPLEANNILAIVLLIFLVPITYFYQEFRGVSFLNNSSIKNIQKVAQSKYKDLNSRRIFLSPMVELSGLSKAEIIELRKKAIKNSVVFSKIENYSPNPNVYNMQDYLPWISAYEIVKNGTKNNSNIGVGPSRHSLMINNPEILLGYIVPDYGTRFKDIEPNETDYFVPKKVIWDEENNKIKVYFDYGKFIKKYKYSYLTVYSDDTNARDLGYNWIYCNSKQGIVFSALNNVSKVPYQLGGYYHRGFACGLKEGCNNYSPMQNKLVYNVVSRDAVVKFKFWKNKPATPLQKADINYEMYFE